MGESNSLTKNSAHKASLYPLRRSILPSFFYVLSFVLLIVILLSLASALALPTNLGFMVSQPSQEPVTTSTSTSGPPQTQTGGWIPVQGLASCPLTQMTEECNEAQGLSFMNQKTGELRKPLPYVNGIPVCQDHLFEAGVLGSSCYDEGDIDDPSPCDKECTEDGLDTGSYFDDNGLIVESAENDKPEACIYDAPRTFLPLCDDIEVIISDEDTRADDEENTLGNSREGSE